jgi:hypothetical protein
MKRNKKGRQNLSEKWKDNKKNQRKALTRLGYALWNLRIPEFSQKKKGNKTKERRKDC